MPSSAPTKLTFDWCVVFSPRRNAAPPIGLGQRQHVICHTFCVVFLVRPVMSKHEFAGFLQECGLTKSPTGTTMTQPLDLAGDTIHSIFFAAIQHPSIGCALASLSHEHFACVSAYVAITLTECVWLADYLCTGTASSRVISSVTPPVLSNERVHHRLPLVPLVLRQRRSP